jgi:hypothetical protein
LTRRSGKICALWEKGGALRLHIARSDVELRDPQPQNTSRLIPLEARMKRLTLLSSLLLVASASGCCLTDACDPCDPCNGGGAFWRPGMFSAFQGLGRGRCCPDSCGCNNCCTTSCCDPCGGCGSNCCDPCGGHGGYGGCGGCNGCGNGCGNPCCGAPGLVPGPTVVPGATVIPGTTVVPGPIPQTIPLQPGPTP